MMTNLSYGKLYKVYARYNKVPSDRDRSIKYISYIRAEYKFFIEYRVPDGIMIKMA